jgi:adenine-specific DNA-methyltransferase
MATTDTKQQLKDLLRELFQLNNTDLDFGIYRIMNIKSKEVENFITKDLDEKVESVKSKILDRQSGDIKAELDESKAKLEKDFKVNFEKDGDLDEKVKALGQLEIFQEPFKKFKTAKDKLDNLRVSEDTEKSIYNELYRFFERYYEGGDFISKPRAGKNNYMIPYEGEEVKLYWANYDQYYIKTGDNFKNYLFNNQSADPKTFTQIEFRILDADTAMNNNKEEKGRLFVPVEEPFEWIAKERKFLVKFNYRVPTPDEKKIWGDKQSVKTESKGINQKLAAIVNDAAKKIKDTELLVLLGKIKANSKGEAITLFQYHLERYTTVNKFDYFIHKNLKDFLHRELDNFLKSDVLSIAFLDADWKEQEVQEAIKNNVLKASAIRDIALVVIDFISELEEFQKRLFEKKKFVIESNYCMTLDRIPAGVYDEVIENILTDKAKKQITDWIDLKFISGSELQADTAKAKGKKKEETTFDTAKKYLIANNKLVLDTKNISDDLKWKLIAAIDNLDESTDGLLINSENYQALNLLNTKYKGKIKCTYIDPPYNTGEDDFIYKDSYRHSSWLCMMYDRLKLAKGLMSNSGGIYTSVDNREQERLKTLLNRVFGEDNFVETFIWTKTSTPPALAYKSRKTVEYIHAFEKQLSNESYKGELLDNGDAPLLNSGNPINELIFPIGSVVTNLPDGKISSGAKEKVELLNDIEIKDGKIITEMKLKGRFKWQQSTVTNEISNDTFFIIKTDKFSIRFQRKDEGGYKAPNNMLELELNKESEIGTNETASGELLDLGITEFQYPKPVSLIKKIVYFNTSNDYIIDYFAGSGTTGHSVIELNKAAENRRRYILVEMGEHFDNVLKKRIKKVVFNDTWKNGIPDKKGKGVSQIFQYIKLEQYEDSVNNIEIHSTAPQLSFMDNIRYQLLHGTKGSDSLINLEKFTKPFNYTMKIVQQNEPKEDTVIDLVTTFNFLLGIDVQRYVLAENNGLEYRIVFGKKSLQQYIIIWRNFDETTIDLKAEKEFIVKQDWYSKTSLVFCNGDNAFSANPIEPEFIRLMNEPVL